MTNTRLNAIFMSSKIIFTALLLIISIPQMVNAANQSPYFVGPPAQGKVVTPANDPYFVGPPAPMDFRGFVSYVIGTLVTPLFGLLVGAAVVFFLWNIFGMIKNADDSEEREHMKERVMWGLIALFVMVSMWGLVGFFSASFGLSNDALHLDQFK